MFFDIRPRRAGKTTEALKRLFETPDTLLVVVNRQRRIWTVRWAEKLYRDVMEPADYRNLVERIVTLEQLRTMPPSRTRAWSLLIDDVGDVLQELLPYGRVDYATGSPGPS